MSKNAFVNPGFGINIERIDLGDLSPLKGPGAAKVASIVARLQANATQVDELIQARDEAGRRIFELRESPAPNLAQALWEGRDASELDENTAAAVDVIRGYENAQANAQALINGRTTAAAIGRRELEIALADAAPELAGATIALAKGIGARLAAAVQMLERAAEEYEAAFGLGNLLIDRAEGLPSLSIRNAPGGPEIALSIAADSVRESVQQWTVMLAGLEDALKPVKKGKARKPAQAPADAPTTPVAPVAPAAAPEPATAESVAFEMGVDDEQH